MKFTTAVVLSVCGVVATIVSTRDGGVQDSPKQVGSVRGLQFFGGAVQGSVALDANQDTFGLFAGGRAGLVVEGGTTQTTTSSAGGSVVTNEGNSTGSTVGVATGETDALVPVTGGGMGGVIGIVTSSSASAGNGAFGGGFTAPNTTITNPPRTPGQIGFNPFFPAETTTTLIASGATGGYGLAAGGVSLSTLDLSVGLFGGSVDNTDVGASGGLQITSVGGGSNVVGAAAGTGTGNIVSEAGSNLSSDPDFSGVLVTNDADSSFAATGNAVFGGVPGAVTFPTYAVAPEPPQGDGLLGDFVEDGLEAGLEFIGDYIFP